MQSPHLEPQPQTVQVDENTKALLKQAQASACRGETVTLDQSTANIKRRLEAWRKVKTETALTT